MVIKQEDVLVEKFIQIVSQENSHLILREVETNYGRPDILVIKYDEKKLAKLKNYGLCSTYIKQIGFILSYLFGKPWIKNETIIKKFDISRKIFLKITRELLELQLIENKDDRYIKLRKYSEILVIKKIFIYEAKLHNWKSAIEQAERHLWFSNDSYILLPNISDKVKQNVVEECKNKNIGLKILINDKKIETPIRINSSKIINSPFLWNLNYRLIRGELL